MKNIKVVISIVSHGNFNEIENLLNKIHKSFYKTEYLIIIRSNIPEKNFISNKTIHVTNEIPLGFGENHNLNFRYLDSFSHFIVLNPDVVIPESFIFDDFISQQISSNYDISTPALYDNPESTLINNIFTFRSLFLLSKFILKESNVYCENISDSYWIAGAFLSFTSNSYKLLGGFNSKKYYMYCEDVDICLRAHNLKYTLFLNKNFKAYHTGKRKSKSNISHFMMHVSSLIKLHLDPIFYKKI